MEKESFYLSLCQQAEALIGGESNQIANFANISALLNISLDRINWVGFYVMENQQLVLGPFQGNPACIRIDLGKGVCGTCAQTGETQVVADVHAFEGHIACDAASNSEIVLPIFKNGDVVAVLDIDSPEFARFDQEDATGLQQLVSIIEKTL